MGFYRPTLCVNAVFAVARSVCLSVCLSVRLSVGHVGGMVDCIHTAKDIAKLLSWSGSPVVLDFFCPKRRFPIPTPRGRSPSAMAQNTYGGENFAIFD